MHVGAAVREWQPKQWSLETVDLLPSYAPSQRRKVDRHTLREPLASEKAQPSTLPLEPGDSKVIARPTAKRPRPHFVVGQALGVTCVTLLHELAEDDAAHVAAQTCPQENPDALRVGRHPLVLHAREILARGRGADRSRPLETQRHRPPGKSAGSDLDPTGTEKFKAARSPIENARSDAHM